jgi:hypothetical protein
MRVVHHRNTPNGLPPRRAKGKEDLGLAAKRSDGAGAFSPISTNGHMPDQ